MPGRRLQIVLPIVQQDAGLRQAFQRAGQGGLGQAVPAPHQEQERQGRRLPAGQQLVQHVLRGLRPLLRPQGGHRACAHAEQVGDLRPLQRPGGEGRKGLPGEQILRRPRPQAQGERPCLPRPKLHLPAGGELIPAGQAHRGDHPVAALGQGQHQPALRPALRRRQPPPALPGPPGQAPVPARRRGIAAGTGQAQRPRLLREHGAEAVPRPILRRTVQGPQAGGQAQRPQGRHPQQAAAVFIAGPRLQRGLGRPPEAVVIVPGVRQQIPQFLPEPDRIVRPAPQPVLQESPPGGEPLQRHPWAGGISPIDLLRHLRPPGRKLCKVILQHSANRVPEILAGQGAHQPFPLRAPFPAQEPLQLSPVSPRPLAQVLPFRPLGSGLGGQAGLPELVRLPPHRRPPRLFRAVEDGWGGAAVRRGVEVEIRPVRLPLHRGLQREDDPLRAAVPLRPPLPPAGQHVDGALPQDSPRLPPPVRREHGNGAERRLVENLQVELRPRPRPPVHLRPEDPGLPVPVLGGLVQPGYAVHRSKGLLPYQSLCPAKHPAVHQHRPGGGCGKPAPIQHRLRLAGPQKPPASIAQGLHPGMVVVAVGPPGCVHLPGRNAHAPQGGHQEGRLLPAPPAAAPVHRQGGGGSLVLRLVPGPLPAPAVYLLHPGLHAGEILHPGPEGVKEDLPVEGQILVIYPGKQHVMGEHRPVQPPAPGGRPPEKYSMADKFQKQLRRIAVQVAGRQVIQQELHGPPLLPRQGSQRVGPITPHGSGHSPTSFSPIIPGTPPPGKP